MAKNLLELLNEVARKAGVNVAEDSVKPLFENQELAKIEIPDAVMNSIGTSLINLDEAKKNHPTLKNHYFAQALDGIDQLLLQSMDEYKFDDDIKNELKLEKSTPKRVSMMIKKVQELENKKANASKPDQKAIQDQINQLHNDLKNEKARADQAIASSKDFERKLRLDYAKDGLLMPNKTIHDTLPQSTKRTILRSLLDSELQDRGAKLDFDEQGNVVLKRTDGTDYFDTNNNRMDAKGFIESTLAKHKQLVTSSSSSSDNNNDNGRNNNADNSNNRSNPPQGGNGRNNADNQNGNRALKGLNDQALKDFEKSASMNGSFAQQGT